jgi:hypothetical protein
MSDQRTVATDALQTLGTIIGPDEKRDAIHLAVEPVTAGATLAPGQRIDVIRGVAWPVGAERGLGIVDPFLTALVQAGERFWFVMYPREVRSLRHVWTHPAFPDEVGTPAPAPATSVEPVLGAISSSKAESERWLRNFVDRADCPHYERVIAAILAPADGYAGGSRDCVDDDYLHFGGIDAHGEIPPEFWAHAEIVLGRKLPHKPSSFSCSC